jgi:hypothetical protein
MREMKIVLFELNTFKLSHSKLSVYSLCFCVFCINIETNTFGNGVCSGLGNNKVVQVTENTLAPIFRENIS